MKQRLNSTTGVFRQVLASGGRTPCDDQTSGHRLPFIGLTRIPTLPAPRPRSAVACQRQTCAGRNKSPHLPSAQPWQSPAATVRLRRTFRAVSGRRRLPEHSPCPPVARTPLIATLGWLLICIVALLLAASVATAQTARDDSPMGFDDARHLLNRTSFAAQTADIENYARLTSCRSR